MSGEEQDFDAGIPAAQVRADQAFREIADVLMRRAILSGGQPGPELGLQSSAIAHTVQVTTLLQLCVDRGLFTLSDFYALLAHNAEETLARFVAPQRPPT